MNLELLVLEVHLANEDQQADPYFCDIQLSSYQISMPIPSEEPTQIPISADMLDQQVSFTLKGREIIGQTKIRLRDLVNSPEARWYPMKSATNKKLIQRASVASLKIFARANGKKKGHSRASSSLSSPTSSLRDLRIPVSRTPASDNPNPSPPRPSSASPSRASSPDSIPLEIEQALIGVNEKVQTFHRLDAEMGKIQHQLAGLMNSIGTAESFEGEAAVQLDTAEDKGDERSPVDDKLGQEIKRTLGYIRSRAGSPLCQSPLYTELEDLRQDLKNFTELQREQEEELEVLREKAVSPQERQVFYKEKEDLARLVSKLNRDLRTAEAATRAAKTELRLLKGDKAIEKLENTTKMQIPKLLPAAIPDYTAIFDAQRSQHKELSEKYDQFFQECAKHRRYISELEEKNGVLSREVEFLKAQTEQKQGEIEGLKQTSRYLEEENRKFKAVGQAAAARIAELTELSKDTRILSDVALLHSEKALAAHLVIAKLSVLLQEKDAELEKYRRITLPKYQPDPADPTDMALGAYLAANLVPVPFVKEELGVYRFGTKRVFLRLEQGNIIIRVGGGYMHLDEFVDIYTPLEMEKLREKPEDPARQALVQRLQEQLDSDYQSCLGVSRVPEHR